MEIPEFKGLLRALNQEIVDCYIDKVDGPIGLNISYKNGNGETKEMTLVNISLSGSCHITADVISDYAVERLFELTGAVDDYSQAVSSKNYTFSIARILNAEIV